MWLSFDQWNEEGSDTHHFQDELIISFLRMHLHTFSSSFWLSGIEANRSTKLEVICVLKVVALLTVFDA